MKEILWRLAAVVGLVFILIAIGHVFGCAKVKPMPVYAPAPVQEFHAKVEQKIAENYRPVRRPRPNKYYPAIHTVIHGDTLWAISGREFENPFLWPLIYRDNRDSIESPDKIQVGQKLKVDKRHSELDKEVAIRAAQKTPYKGGK